MGFKDVELTPMTPEKEEIIALACKQWNQFRLAGEKARLKFRGKQDRWHTQAQWEGTSGRFYARRRIVKGAKKRRKILAELAEHAITQGMYGHYFYSPRNAFFVPGDLLRTEGPYLVMKLVPLTELLFLYEGPLPRVTRVFKRAGKWYFDLPDGRRI